jgi:hypothetical protein
MGHIPPIASHDAQQDKAHAACYIPSPCVYQQQPLQPATVRLSAGSAAVTTFGSGRTVEDRMILTTALDPSGFEAMVKARINSNS